MRFFEEEYLSVCREILDYGVDVPGERTGTGTRMVTNAVIEHSDVERMFPLPVTKKLATKSVFGELLWFLEGSTTDRRLAEITYGDGDHKTIWTANYLNHKQVIDSNMINHVMIHNQRDLGPVYGAQWRGFNSGSVDQLKDVINQIKINPADRRLVVSAWNPEQIDQMALPPCHMIFQFNVRGDRLDLLMMQRSGDMFLGVPFNMASYALLMKIVARETGYKAGKLTIVIGNAHIYFNHIDQVEEQLSRQNSSLYLDLARKYYRPSQSYELPQVLLNSTSQLFDSYGNIGYKVSDFTVTNYNPLPSIKGSMAV